MTQTEEREIRTNRGGMIVVIVLAVIFFVLIALILGGVKRGADPAARGSAPVTVFVVPQKLRIRAEPSAKADVIAQAVQGDKLKMLSAEGAWARVEVNGKEGWAERSALEEPQERDRRFNRVKNIRALPALDGVALEETALYAGPGLFYSVVGELKPKARVKVFTRDHDFFAVEYGKDVAYAEVDAIDLAASEGDTQVDVAVAGESQPTDTSTAVAEVPDEPGVTEPQPEEPAPSSNAVYPSVPAGGTEPRVISRAQPTYPAAARARGTEGTVILRTVVRRDGSVDDVMIIRDQPNGLGDAAADAVRRWRFAPATYQGQPIDVYYTVTVNFRLSN
jgi:TonB family protein